MSYYLKRKPKVGDSVESVQGHAYVVTRVRKTPGGRVEFYEVDSLTTGLMNVLNPREVRGVVRRTGRTDA